MKHSDELMNYPSTQRSAGLHRLQEKITVAGSDLSVANRIEEAREIFHSVPRILNGISHAILIRTVIRFVDAI